MFEKRYQLDFFLAYLYLYQDLFDQFYSYRSLIYERITKTAICWSVNSTQKIQKSCFSSA
jgi:hypothetical protein